MNNDESVDADEENDADDGERGGRGEEGEEDGEENGGRCLSRPSLLLTSRSFPSPTGDRVQLFVLVVRPPGVPGF